MELEKLDKDSAMKEIERSIEDINKFSKGKYKELRREGKLDNKKVRTLAEKANVSRLMVSDFLENEEK